MKDLLALYQFGVTRESLAEVVLAMIGSLNIDPKNCRSQAYDNVSNMTGQYNGLQSHLKKKSLNRCAA